jgi:hydrogenase nickel incorporation protein HypA/HybF
MHELSIAQAILAVVSEHAAGRRVSRVEVEVGHLRQVVPSALAFAFELASSGTEAEGAELVLREVPIEVRCETCFAPSRQDGFPLRCPACGGLEVQIVRGEELSVQSLDVEEVAWASNF